MNKEDLIVGGRYNWKHQPERLVYTGRVNYRGDRRWWYEFALVDKPDAVWCEVLEEDLASFEETAVAALEADKLGHAVEAVSKLALDFVDGIEKGTPYVRDVPKLRGKAQKKADKRARQRARG